MAKDALLTPTILKEVAQATLSGAVARLGEVEGVALDSREQLENRLFVALKGERTDGHLYLEDVLKKKCPACLVDQSEWNSRYGTLNWEEKYKSCIIKVPNSLEALQNLAFHRMRQLDHIHTVGVTGSSGKTTMKELLGSVLSQQAATFASRGNLNSEIGLPASVLELKAGYRYAVFEMGISHPGEMDLLANIVRPRTAIITNIGTAHAEFFQSQEGIAAEKKKIFRFLPPFGRGFIPETGPWASYLREGGSGRILPYGPATTEGFQGVQDLGLQGSVIRYQELDIRYPLFGEYNVLNALGAIKLATALGVTKEQIKLGLESVKPQFGRGEVIRGEVTFIQDCYNANPDSMSKSIAFVDSLAWKGRKILVLGDMLELGKQAYSAHVSLGGQVSGAGVNGVFLFGKETAATYHELLSHSYSTPCFYTEDMEELKSAFQSFTQKGDLVLVKGSRGLELERLSALFSEKEKNRNE